MFNSIFDELKEVKYIKKIITLNIFQEYYNVKYFKETKRLKSLQRAEPKPASTTELLCEYS